MCLKFHIMNQDQVVLHKKRVVSNREISPGVFYLTFEKPGHFRAGQTVAVGVVPGIEPRLYSVASGENEPTMSILFVVVPGGFLTPRMAELKADDMLFVSDPFGAFYGDAAPAYWIASGTGIAPYHAMWKSGMAENKVLIHGGRTASSFYFQSDFQPPFQQNYIRCCSQEEAAGLYHGRLTQYLLEQNNLPLDIKYYLCGSSEMVVETRDILINKGVAFDQIMSEIYF